MAYFNHAFTKVFLGTHATQAASANVRSGVDQGFLTSAGVPSVNLITTAAPYALGLGVFGLFDPSNYQSVNAGSTPITNGAPLVLASTALYQKDKVGPFHGGYQESTKSKMINPKYVSRFYRVDPCIPNANVVHVGNTPYTDEASPATAACCKEFLCDQTYYMRIDVKGSPELRYLSRNGYWTMDYYTGCCAADTLVPLPVDSTLVFIGWAKQAIDNKIVGPFMTIVVYDEAGNPHYSPASGIGPSWDDYVSPGHTDGACAGMVITGAFVDTVFGDCTFYPSDYFEKEPVTILPSEVDETGDPCAFTGVCVVVQCPPRQGMGFGDTVLKDLILSESYMQNYFNTNLDLRIREITQGYDISNAITRSAMYYRYFVLHSVPRFNNPTGVFDNDQYMLEIIVNAPSATFESTMATWLTACNCSIEMETLSCGDACPDVCPTITLDPDPDASPATFLNNGTVGSAYSDTVSASGGDSPYVYEVSGGALPDGLTLNTATGVISGTPTVAADFDFSIRATDDDGCTGTATYTVTISPVG